MGSAGSPEGRELEVQSLVRSPWQPFLTDLTHGSQTLIPSTHVGAQAGGEGPQEPKREAAGVYAALLRCRS